MKFPIYIELELIDGKEQDQDTLIDAFCAQIGKDNGAKPPLKLEIRDGWGDVESAYVVKLADDRP
jgi:hypothetical protein